MTRLRTTTAEAWNSRVTLRLLREARSRVRPFVPSRTLRRDMQIFYGGREQRGVLRFPYFWAVYVHDGRGPFGPRRGSEFLVWFRNPRDDPRTQGGRRYPRRERDIRKLTRAQFEEGLRRNKSRPPGRPLMIVVRRVNRPTPGKPFIEQGLRNSSVPAGREVMEQFGALVVREIIEDTDTVSIRL